MPNNAFAPLIEAIEETLFACLPVCGGETEAIPAMLRYSLEGGGKRVRPLLTLLFCEACGGRYQNALHFAAAVEYVHTYSLIHDDLPCMDNDDLRRGKPSSHKQFGEANALLAGDALLTHAFYLAGEAAVCGEVPAEGCAAAVRELSRLAGAAGMVGGQYIDLAYEEKEASAEVLFEMDRLKTGALIEAAAVLGCIAAGVGAEKIAAARSFAVHLGLAFQIKDDLLEYADAANSDILNGKATYVSCFGFERARALAESHTAEAIAALDVFGEAAAPIRALAEGLLHRTR